MPPLPTHAIDPPPAPRLTMSKLGSATRLTPTPRFTANCGSPFTIGAMSVLVPPMSNAIRFTSDRSRAPYRLAAKPPPGSHRTPTAAITTHSSIPTTPPCHHMIRHLHHL